MPNTFGEVLIGAGGEDGRSIIKKLARQGGEAEPTKEMPRAPIRTLF